MSKEQAKNPLKARLLAMMILRVTLAIGFLSIGFWFQVKEGVNFSSLNLYPLYALVAGIGLLTIVYAALLNKVRNLKAFTYVQVIMDIAIITAIVYMTGASQSYLQMLYPLSVIGASILLNRRGGYFAASLSSGFFGALVYADYQGLLPLKYRILYAISIRDWEEVFTTAFSNVLAFYTVAYLTGYLAERTEKVERELEEKETDLERLENLNRHIIENISSGIMTLDYDQRITSFNREAERVTGYSFKEVYYRRLNDIFPEMLNEEGEPQAGIRIEKKFRKKSGEEIYLGFTVSRGQGGDTSSIIIFQDLTQLKEMEEQLRRDDRLRALGELSVGIAHEIRNPLGSISGSIQLLKEELKLDGEDRKLMDIALRETERLNALISDFLLFARPAQRPHEIANLSTIIRDTLHLFGNSSDAARISIDSDIDENVYIKGDPRQIGQVFWNLFINASHAMPGGGSLNVSLKAYPAGHGAAEPANNQEIAVIKIADTGQGIREEHLDRVFDPFFSTKDTGTGLGLAIVHRIAESHGGTIEVRSTVGKGTVFRITLPVERSVAYN